MLVTFAGALFVVTSTLSGWTADVYSFNRDAWMTDIQIMQQYEYQKDNLVVNLHVMARSEVRDKSLAAIKKTNNVILVSTLIIGLVAEMFVEAQVPDSISSTVGNCYVLCLGSSAMYLTISTIVSITVCNLIYDTSRDLLTVQNPPPWNYLDRRMCQLKLQHTTHKFEQRPASEIFTLPGFQLGWRSLWRGNRLWRRVTGTKSKEEGESRRTDDPAAAGYTPLAEVSGSDYQASAACRANLPRRRGSAPQAEGADSKRLEEDAPHRAIQEAYDLGWRDNEELWRPLLKHSERSIGLGLHYLLQAYAYFCLFSLYNGYRHAWAYWGVQVCFLCVDIVIIRGMFNQRSSWNAFVLVAVSPLLCTVSAATQDVWLDCLLVPCVFMCHLLVHSLLDGVVDLPLSEETQGSLCGGTARRDGGSSRQLIHGGSEEEERTMMRGEARRRWPRLATEELTALQEQSKYISEGVIRMLRRGKYVMRLLWSLATLSMFCKAYSGDFTNTPAEGLRRGSSRPSLRGGGAHKLLDITWPSLFFRPQAIVCPRNSMFMVDHFRIFFSRWESTHPQTLPGEGISYISSLERRSGSEAAISLHECVIEQDQIRDVSSSCDANGTSCWPVVLLDGQPPRIVDCETTPPTVQLLLETTGFVEKFVKIDQDTLVVALDNAILEYTLTSRGWQPHRARQTARGVHSLDSLGQLLFVMRPKDDRTFSRASTVEIIDLPTSRSCGLWELSLQLLVGGCIKAREGGASILELATKDQDGNHSGAGLVKEDLDFGDNVCNHGETLPFKKLHEVSAPKAAPKKSRGGVVEGTRREEEEEDNDEEKDVSAGVGVSAQREKKKKQVPKDGHYPAKKRRLRGFGF